MMAVKRNDILDIFRALSALLIFLYHSLIFGEHGFMGVEILMVLCGFTAMLSSSRLEHRNEFLVKRIVKVVPLYWALTLVMFVLILIMPSLSIMSVASAPDLVRSMLFIPFTNAKGVKAPILSLGWMLEYQMLFFILFAIAIAVSKSFYRYRGVLASALLGVFMLIAKDTFPLEFIYGIALFYLYDGVGGMKERTSASTAISFALSALLFAACIITEAHPEIKRQYLLGILVTLMIAFPLFMASVKMPKAVGVLASCSYEFILIEYFTTAFFKILFGNKSMPIKVLALIVILAVTFVASWIVHLLYDKFCTVILDRVLPSRKDKG